MAFAACQPTCAAHPLREMRLEKGLRQRYHCWWALFCHLCTAVLGGWWKCFEHICFWLSYSRYSSLFACLWCMLGITNFTSIFPFLPSHSFSFHDCFHCFGEVHTISAEHFLICCSMETSFRLTTIIELSIVCCSVVTWCNSCFLSDQLSGGVG